MQVKFIGSLGLTMFMSYDVASIVALYFVVRVCVCVPVLLRACCFEGIWSLCGGLGSGMCLMRLFRLSLCYFC